MEDDIHAVRPNLPLIYVKVKNTGTGFITYEDAEFISFSCVLPDVWAIKGDYEAWVKRVGGEVQDFDTIQAQVDLEACRQARKNEYPPMADYLDAKVKNDFIQEQTYIDACLAVKAKYPKPEVKS